MTIFRALREENSVPDSGLRGEMVGKSRNLVLMAKFAKSCKIGLFLENLGCG